MRERLHGSWNLTSFVIEPPTGGARPWGDDVRGLLLYDPSGRMSVAMNRRPADASGEPGTVLASGLFYAGTFSVLGDGRIHHEVTIASVPEFIGRTLERFATLEGPKLTLETPLEAYGRARLEWRRIEPA